MALLINDSIYSCLFFFLTGLHFFHLTIGLFLLSLLFWSCSFSYNNFYNLYNSKIILAFPHCFSYYLLLYEYSYLVMRLVFWNSIHLEVASDPFCLLINSSWLLVFIFIFFSLLESIFNLYCWKGIHFSQNINSIFSNLLIGLILSFHYWFRDLLRELDKKYEVLLIILFLLFLLFLVSEALLFVSFFWTSFHSLSSPTLGIWPAEGFYLPDPCQLTFTNTLLLSNAAISLGNSFISLEISSSYFIFFTLFS